jgi:sugar lactone lactonase YvrE
MIPRAYIWALAFFCSVTAASAAPTDSAAEQFHSLRAALRQSRTNNDWHANLENANKLKELLNGEPNSLLEVARAQLHVGNPDAALHEVEQFSRMGQSADLAAVSSDFSPLLKNGNFAGIQHAMEANRTSISLGSTAFPLTDSALLAEDVDYDPHTKRFYITSVREKKIVSVDVNGASADFAKSPDDWPMLAVKVDPSRDVVWATEVALQGFIFAREADWGKSAVLCYDAKSGKLLRRIEGPHAAELGDMVLTREGNVIVSDGSGGGVYRVLANGETMERLDNGDFISPQTPTMHPDGKHVFVPDYLRGIGVLDITTKQVRWLPMEGRFALNGIDGLYFDHGKLIAVQNGTSPERVVAFTLDATLSKIVSETIIERSTESLGDPTHGVVIDGTFYYIANSGWDVIDDNGNMKSGAKLSMPRIMKVQLEKL